LTDNVVTLLSIRARQNAFPDHSDTPSRGKKFFLIIEISFNVLIYFLKPKVCSRFWNFKEGTRMPVPETTVDKDHYTMFGQNDVWRTGKRTNIYSVAKALRMKGFPHK